MLARASLRWSLPFFLVCAVSSATGCPDEGNWPDVPRPNEGEGEGEGERENCDEAHPFGVCDANKTCRGGACIDSALVCSAILPDGLCADTAEVCLEGECIPTAEVCSPANPSGRCASELTCRPGGTCASDAPCAPDEPSGFCSIDDVCLDGGCTPRSTLCSPQTPGGRCEAGQACSDGECLPLEVTCGCVGAEVCVDAVCRDPEELCSPQHPDGVCPLGEACVASDCVDIGASCSTNNQTGICPPGSLCLGGVCTGIDGSALCDDDNDCTADVFDGVRNRCLHEPAVAACSDGNECTSDSCVDGLCVGEVIGGCIEPPTVEPVTSPTNINSVVLRGAKPAGSAVQINGATAAAESPDTTWEATLLLVPGNNSYSITSVNQGTQSAARNLVIVYDNVPPQTRISPLGGQFVVGVTATLASNEPATVFFTTDGSDPDELSASFFSLKQLRVFSSTTVKLRARDVAGNFEEEIVTARFEVSARGTSWRTGPALPEPVLSPGTAVTGDTLYLAGGSDGTAPQAGAYAIHVQTGAVTTLASLPTARAALALAVNGSRVFAIGGDNAGVPQNKVEILSDDTWSAGQPMPSTRSALAAISIDSRIFVFGGKTNSGAVLANVEVYEVNANTWTNAVAQMPRPRAGFGAVLVGGKIYLVGGEGAGGSLVAEVDVYNPATDTWSQAAPLPTPRAFLATGLIENEGIIASGTRGIVAAGGVGVGGTSTAVVEEYIVEEDRWLERAALDAPRHAMGSASVYVERGTTTTLDDIEPEVWILGGQSGADVVASTRAFRSPRDYARPLAPLPDTRFLHGAAAVDGKVYLVGGRSFTEESLGFVYDPETGTSDELPQLASLQSGLSVLAVDGLVYAIGGSDGFGNAVPTTRAYDPAARNWIELAPMPSARSGSAAATVDGFIVIIGGDNGGAVQTVEFYDTRSDSWQTGPLLPVARVGAMAVSHNGFVYVIGGVDGADAAVTSVIRTSFAQDGALHPWEALPSADRNVSFGAAVVVRNNVLVLPGRGQAGLGATPGVLALNDADARFTSFRGDTSLLPELDRFPAVVVNDRVLMFGGNDTPEIGPAGVADTVELIGRCANGVVDGFESSADSGDGCPGLRFLHQTGTGISFENDFPHDITSLARALDACNAVYGSGCLQSSCSGSPVVLLGGGCFCPGAGNHLWYFGTSFTYANGTVGDVRNGDCSGSLVGRWD